MYFLIEDDYLSENSNTVWDKKDIKKEFDSESVYKKNQNKVLR